VLAAEPLDEKQVSVHHWDVRERAYRMSEGHAALAARCTMWTIDSRPGREQRQSDLGRKR
jgi:hypothetical protein